MKKNKENPHPMKHRVSAEKRKKNLSLQTAAAAAVCKAARTGLHLAGRGGTALPGRLGMLVQKDLLAQTSQGVRTILVTGTNGKTTTTQMLVRALESAGQKVLTNRSGANLLSGITAEFAAASDWRGRPAADAAVIECDEGALHQVTPLLQPWMIIVTNLFRDQLDRYGEVMHTREAILEGIRAVPGTILCLNADDSLVATMAEEVPNRILWFGFGEETGAPEDQIGTDLSDGRYCIRCGTPYAYHFRTFAHLGAYYCPACGLTRPDPDTAVTGIEEASTEGTRVRMRIRVAASEMQIFRIGIPALYNVYNAAAAVCACTAMELPAEKIAEALADPSGSFGRMESFDLDGLRVQMILVKNPAGCSQALQYLCSVREPFAAAFFLNDLDADGHDISWIWDVDYEKLCGLKNLRRIYVGGLRAGDMALRLKYAGFPEDRIHWLGRKEDPVQKLRKSRIPVFILPNYTAMVPLRERLAGASGKKKYWEVL